MVNNPSTPNHQPRMTRTLAVLAASAALYACTPVGDRPELTNETIPVEATVGLGSVAIGDPESATLNPENPIDADSVMEYFADPERNAKVHEQVGNLAELAAELSRESDRFETQVYENKLGQQQIDMFGADAQGNSMLISILGRSVPESPTTFTGADGPIEIEADSLFITVVPKDAEQNFYNYDSDVSFTQIDGKYRTTLRVELDGQSSGSPESDRRSKYYVIDENSVNAVIINHQNPDSIKGGESDDVEMAILVDKYAFERARQLLLSTDNAGPVGNYYYSDNVLSELISHEEEHESPGGYDEGNSDEESGEPGPGPKSGSENITPGTVPRPTIIGGTIVHNTVPQGGEEVVGNQDNDSEEMYTETNNGTVPGTTIVDSTTGSEQTEPTLAETK